MYNGEVLIPDSEVRTAGSITTVTFYAPDLGDRSYLLSDGKEGVVVDPQRDPFPYLEQARNLGITITAVLETHIHNDYVSGGLALARTTGATYAVPAGEPIAFSNECRALADGESLTAGRLTVTAIATAGHTAHHLAYAVRAAGHRDPGETVVCTGGSLLVNATGRTDLLGSELAEALAHSQWRSVRRVLRTLPRDARILPTHGFGSFCSAAPTSGDSATVTTTGQERVKNPAALLDEHAFVTTLLANLPPIPTYYRYMAPLNRTGMDAPRFGPVPDLDADDLEDAIRGARWVVDLRQRRVFAAGHIPGTTNFELGSNLTTYLGWIVPWDAELVLLAERPEEVDEARRLISRIGRDDLVGAALWPTVTGRGADGQESKSRISSYPVAAFSDLADTWADRATGPQVVDVRHPDEWHASHIVGARHIPLQDLSARRSELRVDEPVWVHCAAGFRASVAASLLSVWGSSPILIDAPWSNAIESGLPIASDDRQTVRRSA